MNGPSHQTPEDIHAYRLDRQEAHELECVCGEPKNSPIHAAYCESCGRDCQHCKPDPRKPHANEPDGRPILAYDTDDHEWLCGGCWDYEKWRP